MTQISSEYFDRSQKQTIKTQGLLVRFFSRQSTLLLVIAVAVLLRVGAALLLGNEVTPLPGTYDQVSYDALARRVMAGAGFSFAQDHWPYTKAGEPTAHWSYLYTLYLTAIYSISGASPLLARILQAVIAGILHTWLVWRIGKRIGAGIGAGIGEGIGGDIGGGIRGQAVGVVAALFSALYLYFVYYAGALMTESFYIVGILWTLDCALRLAAPPGLEEEARRLPRTKWSVWLELGLAIGFTVLLRQVFLLFVPFLLMWLGWTCLHKSEGGFDWQWPTIRRWLAGSILSMVIVLALIAPWTVHNYRAFGTFIPLNTNSGYAFFWGNHTIYGTNFVGILPEDGPSYQDLIPVELRDLNEAELDRALLKEGMKLVFDDPVRYLLLSISRTREYFKFWPSAESGTLSNVARVASFGLFLPLILYGLGVSAVVAWRSTSFYQRAIVVLLGLFCVVYTMLHLLTWALIRYRLPVDAVFLIFAAVGAITLLQKYLVDPDHITRREATQAKKPMQLKQEPNYDL